MNGGQDNEKGHASGNEQDENEAQQLGRGCRLQRATNFGSQSTNGENDAVQSQPCGVAG